MGEEKKKYEPIRAAGYFKSENQPGPHLYLRAIEDREDRVTEDEERQLDRIERKLDKLLALVEGEKLVSITIDDANFNKISQMVTVKQEALTRRLR